MNKIITINRQFGSGGREVGKRLADVLAFAYYDHELLEKIAEKTGASTEFISSFDEKFTRSYGYTFGRTFGTVSHSTGDKIQLEYARIFKEIAENHSAVIVGRCANHILAKENPLKIFIYSSDMNFRVERSFEKVPSDRDSKTEKQMAKEILSVDKRRAKYHEFYTGQTWGNMGNYNLCIDTSDIGIKGAVEVIVKALEER